MVEFKLEEDVPKELARGNYFKAVMMCHDWLQMELAYLLSSAFSYLNNPLKSFRYVKFDNFKYMKLKFPRMADLIKNAWELGLISESERNDIIKVKDFRNKASAHDTLFFDKKVLAGEIQLKEILAIKEISFKISKRLSDKLALVGNAMTSDMRRVVDGEDINSVLKEHTHDKLIQIIEGY